MALTNEDLSAIAQLMDTKLFEFETRFDAKMDIKIEQSIQPLRQDISNLRQDVTEVKQEVADVKQEIADIKLDVADVKQEVADIKLDVADVKQEVADIKLDVADVKLEVADIRLDVTNIKLHLENITDRNVRILAENYLPAAIRYEKATLQIEELQRDNVMIKKVLAEHSRMLQSLA